MIYLDNAATSYPKPKEMLEQMTHFITEVGSNVNRGIYGNAYEAESIVFETRQKLCKLFDFPYEDHVVFTQSVTYAFNMIIYGLFQKGDHVLISGMEHNAVVRPLYQKQKDGVEISIMPCTTKGELILDNLQLLVKSNTKAVIVTAASNVCGTILPLKEIGEFCKKNGLIFIVDSAQGAGAMPISMKKMQIDLLAFTGHKGLLGPQGIGGFLVEKHLASQMKPVVVGGTGSFSEQEEMPQTMPDKFEAGTMNLPGIYGLYGSLQYLEKLGVDTIAQREQELLSYFLKELEHIQGIHIIGKKDCINRLATVSIQCDFMDEAELAFQLEQKYGIMARVGLHCAPLAHKSLGTFPRGTLRFSLGYETKKEDIVSAIQGIRRIQFESSK